MFREPSKRPSATKLLEHPFITGLEFTSDFEAQFAPALDSSGELTNSSNLPLTDSNELRRSDNIGLSDMDDVLTQESIISFLRDQSLQHSFAGSDEGSR
jgi:hypothetical protein